MGWSKRVILAAGLLAVAALLIVGGGFTLFLESINGLSSAAIISLTLLTVCAAAGIFTHLTFKRGSAALAEALKRAGDIPMRVGSRNSELVPLATAIQEFAQNSTIKLHEAQQTARNLEIQLKVASAELQQAEEMVEDVSDSMPETDGEIGADSGTLAAQRSADASAVAASIDDLLLRDPRLTQLIQQLKAASSDAAPRTGEHRLHTSAGERTFHITLAHVEDAQAGDKNLVAFLHDVTREKEVADLKNDFVSSVSHELRTPLASIKAYVEMLIDGEANSEKTKRDFYEVIQNEANRLSRLIDNILNVSRIESGLVRVNRQKQNVTQVIGEAIEVIAPQAASKSLVIEQALTDAHFEAMIDRDLLYQAVLNLLSNAVKYTPDSGKINIQTVLDDQRNLVIVRVTDTGTGIPASDLPFIFEKFYRVDANSHTTQGTGLGLSLVKHIVETAHGGRVNVRSEIGKGSCFELELPLCSSSDTAPAGRGS